MGTKDTVSAAVVGSCRHVPVTHRISVTVRYTVTDTLVGSVNSPSITWIDCTPVMKYIYSHNCLFTSTSVPITGCEESAVTGNTAFA